MPRTKRALYLLSQRIDVRGGIGFGGRCASRNSLRVDDSGRQPAEQDDATDRADRSTNVRREQWLHDGSVCSQRIHPKEIDMRGYQRGLLSAVCACAMLSQGPTVLGQTGSPLVPLVPGLTFVLAAHD